MGDEAGTGMARPSAQSRAAWSAAHFFPAYMKAGVMPFHGTFLRAVGSCTDAIGVAVGVHGLGTLLPAGMVLDRVTQRRLLLAAASLAVAFFAPLLGALALDLVGRERLGRTIGANQVWTFVLRAPETRSAPLVDAVA